MRYSVPLGTFMPGASCVHRAPSLAKFLAVLALIPAVTILPTRPWHTGAVVVAVAVLYAVARIPPRTAASQLAPVVPLLTALGVYLWWQNGPAEAATTSLGLVATLAAANLLMLTTPMGDLLAALERAMKPLDRCGVPTETISLAIALTIRLIPLMFSTVSDVLDARKARGVSFSLNALGTPVLIRSIRRAENISDALLARGVADD